MSLTKNNISHTMQVVQTICVVLICILITSCRVTKHIPEDKDVVSKVHIMVDGQPSSNNSLKMAVQQKPYHRTFGFLPVAAWMWHNDTINGFHKWRNKIGTEPLAYDIEKTLSTERSMLRTLSAQGYLHAKVNHDVESKNRKATVTYNIERGEPKRINDVKYLVEDPALENLVMENAGDCYMSHNALLDRNSLDDERTRLTSLMRNNGFWDFNKDNISFIADTLKGKQDVDLTVIVSGLHEKYSFNKVHFVTNFDIMRNSTIDENISLRDIGDGYDLRMEGEKCYLKENTLIENCYIVPGNTYTENAVRDTYSAFSRLHLLKYTNIRLEPVDYNLLDVYVYTSPQNPKSLQFELDGTNTSGDLGFAGALTYQHKNLFRGSETYSLSLKGGYESLTGNVSGLVNNNYSEYSIENSLDIPKFIVPFITEEAKRTHRATTSFNASFSYQTRPEYTRYISTVGFGYKWQNGPRQRHTWDVIDLSYVYLPKRSESFIEIIEQAGPISYSSYSSHLIMSMGYNFYISNQQVVNQSRNSAGRDIWSLRVNAEVAGNTLLLLSKIIDLKKDENGDYNIFGLPFEQYARLDMDWSYSKYLTDRSRLAYHVAGGVAVPYGNSQTVPFEKRYYAGGANSVRGWSVRTLGPGSYLGATGNKNIDYFNQCGDVRFDAAVELRSKLFWKFEFATFLDAGNVWTLKDYKSQPGGKFTSDFYRQIAAATGVGLRMITDFVVLRLDMGIRAYNPYYEGSSAWTIRHPLRGENRTIHFAVGYPF